jgi:ribonuclease P protein component
MTAPATQELRPADRLRRAVEFQQVFRSGLRAEGRFMALVVAPGDAGRARLGLAASRRIGGAVQRNRAKRRLRECFRTQARLAALDVVALPKGGLNAAAPEDVRTEYRRLLEQLRRRLQSGRREKPVVAADRRV